MRKRIVATTEGGAITGEERLREHTDALYGALLSYEGRPASHQLANIKVLQDELKGITQAFEGLLKTELAAVNLALKAAGRPTIAAPEADDDEAEEADDLASANPAAGAVDKDALFSVERLPAGFRPMR